jgi:hypothetical protein
MVRRFASSTKYIDSLSNYLKLVANTQKGNQVECDKVMKLSMSKVDEKWPKKKKKKTKEIEEACPSCFLITNTIKA